MSGVSTSVSSISGYLLLFHPILGYPILRAHFYKEEGSKDSDDDYEDPGPPNIFKPKKNNLPSTRPPKPLSDYLGATRSDILGSCKKDIKPNISASEKRPYKN